MALPRRSTLQGGAGRARTYDGRPNVRAQGIMQRFLGRNPVRMTPPGPPQGLGGTPPARGLNPNSFLRDSYQGDRNPLQHVRWWENAGWDFRPKTGSFAWGGGPGSFPGRVPPGGPDRGGGRPGPGNPGPTDQDRTPPGLPPGLGMPLDPLFEGDRRMIQDQLMARLAQAQNAFQTGTAQVDEQGLLQNRGLDENVAARGLYGSGIERRGERLIGNEVARGKLGLLQALTGEQSSAEMDQRRALQEALLNLALRQQQNENLPIPYGQTQGQGRKRAGAPRRRPNKRNRGARRG